MKNRSKRVGAFFYMPLLFMLFGYIVIFVVGAPIVNFSASAVQLILLNDAPKFDQKVNNLFESVEASEKESFVRDGKLPSSSLVYPTSGDQFGQVIIEKSDINEPLFYGDSEDILRLGAGQYISSMMPGEQGTTLIGGHNYPSYGRIYYLEPDDSITISTHYGDYVYKVTENKISRYDDPIIIERLGDRSKHSLILYTCYPLDAIGLTPERVFIFADYVSGPLIDGSI